VRCDLAAREEFPQEIGVADHEASSPCATGTGMSSPATRWFAAQASERSVTQRHSKRFEALSVSAIARSSASGRKRFSSTRI
jgi:hypothetical protein